MKTERKVVEGWKEKLKQYGIKNKKINEWIRFGNGAIFWTTSAIIAQEQMKIGTATQGDLEITEFI